MGTPYWKIPKKGYRKVMRKTGKRNTKERKDTIYTEKLQKKYNKSKKTKKDLERLSKTLRD